MPEHELAANLTAVAKLRTPLCGTAANELHTQCAGTRARLGPGTALPARERSPRSVITQDPPGARPAPNTYASSPGSLTSRPKKRFAVLSATPGDRPSRSSS